MSKCDKIVGAKSLAAQQKGIVYTQLSRYDIQYLLISNRFFIDINVGKQAAGN
ncbi:MAG: hypothetical protein NVSMB27_27320 [Ktedonobacteraceae bacterium]